MNAKTKEPGREIAMSAPTNVEQFFGLMQTMVTNKDIDPAKMQGVLDVMERMMNKEAETEFNRDYMAVKSKIPRIIKDGQVEYEKGGVKEKTFKFASYEAIDRAITKIEKEYGFARSFTTDPKEGGGVIVTCTLRHAKGHSITSSIPVALDSSGGKNNIQGMGSSYSYGKRYTTCMVWDIVTVNEDDDGDGAHERITTEQAERLKAAVDFAGASLTGFLAYLGADSIEDIKARDFNKANMALKSKVEGTPVKK